MQLVNNYLDNIKSHLPEELQQEVSDELEASIYGQVEDKQEELNRELEEKEVEAILLRIGHPMRVASSYLPGQEVVGKELFPAYKKALEIALTVTILITILAAVPAMFNKGSIIGAVISVFSSVLNSGLYVFGLVTLIFYLMGYYGVNLNEVYAWSPKNLSSKAPKLKLDRVETGFELFFSALFLAWWNDALNWPSNIILSEHTTYVSFSEEWHSIFFAVNIVVGLSILVAIHKFVTANWSKFSLAADIALSLAAIAICFQISQFEEFVVYSEEFQEHKSWDKVTSIMDNIVYGLLIFISAVSAWEIFTNFKKVIRKLSRPKIR